MSRFFHTGWTTGTPFSDGDPELWPAIDSVSRISGAPRRGSVTDTVGKRVTYRRDGTKERETDFFSRTVVGDPVSPPPPVQFTAMLVNNASITDRLITNDPVSDDFYCQQCGQAFIPEAEGSSYYSLDFCRKCVDAENRVQPQTNRATVRSGSVASSRYCINGRPVSVDPPSEFDVEDGTSPQRLAIMAPPSGSSRAPSNRALDARSRSSASTVRQASRTMSLPGPGLISHPPISGRQGVSKAGSTRSAVPTQGPPSRAGSTMSKQTERLDGDSMGHLANMFERANIAQKVETSQQSILQGERPPASLHHPHSRRSSTSRAPSPPSVASRRSSTSHAQGNAIPLTPRAPSMSAHSVRSSHGQLPRAALTAASVAGSRNEDPPEAFQSQANYVEDWLRTSQAGSQAGDRNPE